MSHNTDAWGEGKKRRLKRRRLPHASHPPSPSLSCALSLSFPFLHIPLCLPPSLSFLSHNTLATWFAARRKACRPKISRRESAGKLRRECAGILCTLHLRSGKPLTRGHFEAVFASRVVSLCVEWGKSRDDMQVPGVCLCLCQNKTDKRVYAHDSTRA